MADPGPEEGEGSFTDQEWRERFDEDGVKWQELCRSQNVDGMWSMLEESLISCHKIRAATFHQPRGKVTNKCEEAPHNTFTGCAETEATIAATNPLLSSSCWAYQKVGSGPPTPACPCPRDQELFGRGCAYERVWGGEGGGVAGAGA